MKLQIDTELKLIKIEEKINLGELIKTLEQLLPKGLWKEFELENTVINNWTNPIIIQPTPYVPQNPYPTPILPWMQGPFVYCSNVEGTNSNLIQEQELNNGIYNVQI